MVGGTIASCSAIASSSVASERSQPSAECPTRGRDNGNGRVASRSADR